MRKIILFISMLTMSILLVACGTTNDGNETQGDQPVIEDNKIETNEERDEDSQAETNNEEQSDSESDDEVAKMDRLDYVEFELEVEYANDKEYEAELEKKSDGRVEAEIEDELKGIHLEGSEAFDELYPLVEQLTITQETTKEEAIEEILDVFQLDANYEEFEVELTFKDGTKIEFKDKK